MRTKIDRVERNLHLLRCPICGKAFALENSSLKCASGHCFDINKKGFVNLIPSQKPTKYDTQLFMARRRILEAGFYSDLIGKLNELCNGSKIVLDAGCGDGYFTTTIKAGQIIGVDIAKEAIELCSKVEGNGLFLVGDLTRLPLADESVDTIVNILSPAHYPEFGRVLKKSGKLIKVIPDADYLREVRTIAGKDKYSNEQVKEHFAKNTSNMEIYHVHTSLPVTNQQAKDIIKMTPMTFSVNEGDIDDTELTSITISLEILLGTL